MNPIYLWAFENADPQFKVVLLVVIFIAILIGGLCALFLPKDDEPKLEE